MALSDANIQPVLTRNQSARAIADTDVTKARYPTPLNEFARLNALHDLRILDTPADERFDRIARLAAMHFGTPLARITFVDKDRTWYKACFGVEATESPRELAICAHTVMSNEVLVSCDLAQDPRFCESPQVTGEPHLRFYAGAPIALGDGMRVGSLCIIDVEPRVDFSSDDRKFLTDLAEIAVHELELHKQIATRDQSLQVAERQLVAAQDAKRRFLSLVSHELKTPLNHILGFGRIIAEEGLGSLGNQNYVDYANCVCQSAERLEGLISRVLSYSSAEAGDLQLTESHIDTAAMVAKCRRLVDLQSKAAQVDIAISFGEQAPPGLFADEVQVEEVLVQVLDNAIAFSPGGGTVELTVDQSPAGGVSICICDLGPGVEPGEIDRLMIAFTQGDESLSRTHEGIGLGLPIARAIMELHGGTLTLASRQGGGTIVQAAFPAQRKRSERSAAPSPTRDDVSDAPAALEIVDLDAIR